MSKRIPPALLALGALAACTSTSGPTFNAASIDLADGARAYRVECHGLAENEQTCQRVAQRICADRTVKPIKRRGSLTDPEAALDDPRVLAFKCEPPAAPEHTAPVAPDTPAAQAQVQ